MVQSRQSSVLAVTIAVLVISSVFVFFRFVSKIIIVRRARLDDYLILVAWVRTRA